MSRVLLRRSEEFGITRLVSRLGEAAAERAKELRSYPIVASPKGLMRSEVAVRVSPSLGNLEFLPLKPVLGKSRVGGVVEKGVWASLFVIAWQLATSSRPVMAPDAP